jgi:GxxExxY protein
MGRRGAEDAEGKGGLVEPDGELNRVTEAVIGAAIEVHRVLGPGYLESLYERAMCLEMTERGIAFVRQAPFSIFYKGAPIGETRLDLLVDRQLLVELKATEGCVPVHLAQVMSYLKATRLTLGLLINFNVRSLRHGVRRVIHTHQPSAPSAPLRPSPQDSRQ